MPMETIEHLAPAPDKKLKIESGKLRILAILAVILVALIGFWYKTNSWPIVAIAGLRPITRFEINQDLFSQYGKTTVEDKITEVLVKNELDKTGVTVNRDEIQKKIGDIKTSLGEGTDLNKLLADRGMSQQEFEKQLELQMRVEKALLAKIEITDKDVSDYLEANKQFISASGEAAVVQAREALKYSKLQEAVGKWIDELKVKAKIWRAPGV